MNSECCYPVLLTVTGVDQPGITAALTHVLVQGQTSLLDIEQVVVHGQLTLCFLVDLDIAKPAGKLVLMELLLAARKKGQNLEYEINKRNTLSSHQATKRYAITVMGSPVNALAMNQLSSILSSHEANIISIRRLSNDDQLSSLEVLITIVANDQAIKRLKEDLMQQLSSADVDIALQRESLIRRSKRLVVLDMDSTLIQIEVIDELASYYGVKNEVAAITHEAMHGRYDFCESLKKRVAFLKGLPCSYLAELAKNLPLDPGAEELIAVLKGLGYKVGIISGGFHIAADTLKKKLGLDFAYANRLEICDGVLTGQVLEPIIDAKKKADLLEWIAHKEQISLEQTIAIGDGANDALMLSRAGLGIAFHAKPILKKAASTSVSSGGLERILYFLGMCAQDIREFIQK
jgi:phosphoserine phosphatase